ncbi:major facilitator superfamily domain-containing protein [Xylaria palmicola]|nr:major facilitator superfamily domain-containing protein [Xylaria palmicola]
MTSQERIANNQIGPAEQPDGRRLLLIMIGLCLAVFLTGMDQTILATATVVISDDFHALRDIAWWSNAYLLTLSSFQLFYGKLYTLFSIKKVYMAAIVLFEIGSLICTVAPNSVALIIGRAIAGLGAAGIFSGGILITTKIIPLSKRASYLGIMSGAFGVAAIFRNILGSILAIARSALLVTLNLETSTGRIVGYELLYGFGVGFGFGQPSYVVQTVLDPVDVPIGITLITLLQNLSASIFTAVAQSLFQGELRRRLLELSPNIDISTVLGSGANDFLTSLPPNIQAQARDSLSTSIVHTFYISLALSAASFIPAITTRWHSMKNQASEKDFVAEQQQQDQADKLTSSEQSQSKGLEPTIHGTRNAEAVKGEQVQSSSKERNAQNSQGTAAQG